MLGSDRLNRSGFDPSDERAGDRLRFADLGDYYPVSQPPPQTVNGSQPVTPAGSPSAVSGKAMGAPAVWVALIVAGSLLLMHLE